MKTSQYQITSAVYYCHKTIYSHILVAIGLAQNTLQHHIETYQISDKSLSKNNSR